MAHKNVDYKPEDIQFPNQKIVQSELVHEMQSSYIEYAMSVIVGRLSLIHIWSANSANESPFMPLM